MVGPTARDGKPSQESADVRAADATDKAGSAENNTYSTDKVNVSSMDNAAPEFIIREIERELKRFADMPEASARTGRGPALRLEMLKRLDTLNPDAVTARGGEVAAGGRAKFEAAPAAKITGEEIFKADEQLPAFSQIYNKMIAWLSERGWLKKFLNNDSGWDISVSRQSIRSAVYHGAGRGKAQALAALPDIIKNGIYVAPGKILENGNRRHIFAAKINIKEELFVVGFVVEENRNGKKFYNHELTEIENLDSQWRPQGESRSDASRDSSVMNIVQKHLGVKTDMALYQAQGPLARGQVHCGDPVTAEENYSRGLEAMDKVIKEQTDIPVSLSGGRAAEK